ncbi:S41 family peptidase [Erythrobacter sp. NE805]|uniref:S41 family peptidase n=1 Tax=Erythrobacter sp. NE805 TaxID=3389875 RepID=UPI00396AF681
MRILLLAAAAAVLPAGAVLAQSAAPAVPAAAPAATPFDPAVGREAVAALATRLEEDFVFPDKGRAYAAMLRANLAAGKYDGSASAEAFAKAVSADLQAVSPDGHLRVHVVPPEARGGPEGERQGGGGPGMPGPDTNTITGSGWLAEGVAYIGFDAFFGTEATMAALRSFIAEHRGAKTLIIDIRGHRGGGLAEMDLLFPEIYAEPTTLVAMDTRASVAARQGSPVEDARVRRVAGPEGMVRDEHYVEPAKDGAFQRAQVFVLTSKRSASAAEHLALALKGTARATLIGETTYGAGNFGGMVPLDKGFSYAAFVPNGRTLDPRTGVGWEGTGIAPDVAVPASEALDEALRRAGVDPATARKP